MTLPLVQCAYCRHFMKDRFGGNFCDAFPDGDGIPRKIIDNQADHRQPDPGDNGIRFEPVDDDAANTVAVIFEEGSE